MIKQQRALRLLNSSLVFFLMTKRIFSRFLLLVALMSGLGFAAQSQAEDSVTVDAKLIWATDHDKAPNKNYKNVDKLLSVELKKVFKWKNYFVIESKEVKSIKNKKVAVKMSDQCRLKIKYLGDDMFEVWIWGKDPKTGKEAALAKGKQKIGTNQKMMLMGVNDNESGWVVKLCRD